MPDPISQNVSTNVGIAASNAPDASQQNPQATPQGQAARAPLSAAQLAQASQVAAEKDSVKIELSKRKEIQNPKRTEGAFEPEENEERKDVTHEKVKEKSESALHGAKSSIDGLDITI